MLTATENSESHQRLLAIFRYLETVRVLVASNKLSQHQPSAKYYMFYDRFEYPTFRLVEHFRALYHI
eukprot:g79261.t1